MNTMVTALNGGRAMNSVLFYQMLNSKKNILEASRDWMILRTIDTSLTFSSSDLYTSGKTLPARFLRTYTFTDQAGNLRGPYIINSAGSKVPLLPIKLAERYDYKDTEGYYWIDVKNSTIGRTGTTAGTLYLPYLQGTADIAAGTTWEFPTFAHPILPFEVAVVQKGGIDWDRVNANQVPYNLQDIRDARSALIMWDARLQQAELGV